MSVEDSGVLSRPRKWLIMSLVCLSGALLLGAILLAGWNEFDFDAPTLSVGPASFEPRTGALHPCASVLSITSIPRALTPRKNRESPFRLILQNSSKKTCNLILEFPKQVIGGKPVEKISVRGGDQRYPVTRQLLFKDYGPRIISLKASFGKFTKVIEIKAIVRPTLWQFLIQYWLASLPMFLTVLGGVFAAVKWVMTRETIDGTFAQQPSTPEQTESPAATSPLLPSKQLKTAPPQDRTKLPPLCVLPIPSHMLFRSMRERFAGRIHDFWELHAKLESEDICVIGGTGGLGKTQLATEYGYRMGYLYPGGVFQTPANQGHEAIIAIIKQTLKLNIDERLPTVAKMKDMWKALASRKPILFILDNLPEKDSLHSYLPTPGINNCHIIATVRSTSLPEAETLELKGMDDDESFELLNSGKRTLTLDESQTVNGLLGGLPLALELARNQLNRRAGIGVDEFIQDIKSRGEIQSLQNFAKEYHGELPAQHEKDIVATFQLSYELATEISCRILHALAGFAEAPVPRRLLRRVFEDELSNEELESAISELHVDLALLDLDDEGEPTLHRLIRAFLKTIVSDGNLSKHMSAAISHAILDEMKRVTDLSDTDALKDLEAVLPHAEAEIEKI